jgi:hypothetical protein
LESSSVCFDGLTSKRRFLRIARLMSRPGTVFSSIKPCATTAATCRERNTAPGNESCATSLAIREFRREGNPLLLVQFVVECGRCRLRDNRPKSHRKSGGRMLGNGITPAGSRVPGGRLRVSFRVSDPARKTGLRRPRWLPSARYRPHQSRDRAAHFGFSPQPTKHSG